MAKGRDLFRQIDTLVSGAEALFSQDAYITDIRAHSPPDYRNLLVTGRRCPLLPGSKNVGIEIRVQRAERLDCVF